MTYETKEIPKNRTIHLHFEMGGSKILWDFEKMASTHVIEFNKMFQLRWLGWFVVSFL